MSDPESIVIATSLEPISPTQACTVVERDPKKEVPGGLAITFLKDILLETFFGSSLSCFCIVRLEGILFSRISKPESALPEAL